MAVVFFFLCECRWLFHEKMREIKQNGMEGEGGWCGDDGYRRVGGAAADLRGGSMASELKSEERAGGG